MRTTIDISDALFKKAKAIAVLKGLTLKKFITLAIEHELVSSKLSVDNHRIVLPLIPSKRPGSVAVTPENIAEILEQEDLHGIR